MTDHVAVIAGNKQICTGVALDYRPLPDRDPLPDNETAFDALVTRHYKLFREAMRDDVAFLRSVEDPPSIANYDRAVKNLRHAVQHDDTPQEKVFYANWTRDRSWESAAKDLWDAAEKALSDLARISSTVRRDPELTMKWRDCALVESGTVFDAVCRDLGARFGRGVRLRLIGNVDHRRRRIPAGADVRTAVAQLCVQEITAAQDLSLPVPHYEILDRLGLLGAHNARTALLMAYSVSAATGLTGEAFLQRVEQTWQVGTS